MRREDRQRARKDLNLRPSGSKPVVGRGESDCNEPQDAAITPLSRGGPEAPSRTELVQIAGSERRLVTSLLPPRAVELVTPREAAALLGVSRDTVYRLCGDGAIPHRRVGNQIRIRRADLLGDEPVVREEDTDG